MNLAAMGIAGPVRVFAPAVAGLQPAAGIDPRAVVVPAKQGLFLRVVAPAAAAASARSGERVTAGAGR